MMITKSVNRSLRVKLILTLNHPKYFFEIDILKETRSYKLRKFFVVFKNSIKKFA